MKKIYFKHFLVTLLLCSTVATAHDFEVDGIYYNITSNKTVEVTYRGGSCNQYSNEYTGSVVIPSSVTYNGTTYSVTTIGNHAFGFCDGLTSITIPNSVTGIGNYAFYDCSGLTSVTIPNSVTTIGESAFQNCTILNNVTIPNSVISIGDFAFCSTAIVSIIIPKGITDIGNSTFYGCQKLKRVTLYENVTNIADAAFYDCHNLKIVYNYSPLDITTGSVDNGYIAFYAEIIIKEKIDIQNSFVFTTDSLHTLIDYFGRDSVISLPSNYNGENYKIGRCAFYNDDSLANVTIPNSVTSIGGSAFAYCDGLTNVTIGNGVTSIGGSAFNYCTSLTSITIGNSVTSIGYYVFDGCYGLKEIYVKATTPPTARLWAFDGCPTASAILYVPVGSKDAYAAANGWSKFYNIVEMEFTGIDEVVDEVKGENSKVKDVYDLSGRKVTNPTKGIYIVNGKKVLLK